MPLKKEASLYEQHLGAARWKVGLPTQPIRELGAGSARRELGAASCLSKRKRNCLGADEAPA